MGSRILWAVVGGFLVGVFVRSFVPIGFAFAGFAALLAVTALLLSRTTRGTLVIAVALLAFAAGIARMDAASLSGDPVLTQKLDSKVTLEGMVSAEPDVRETGTRISVAVSALVEKDGTRIPVNAGVLILAPPHTEIAYGDRVRVSGTLQLPQAFDTGEGRQFDYPEYLAASGIAYELDFAQIDRTGENDGNILQAAAINAKELYLRGENAVLADPEAALAGGITVGDKRSIGPELTGVFERDSLIHMVVLSGYNITVVINAVRWLLQLLPRSVQYGGAASAVVFFILMSGGASSAVRAGAMALIAVFARATGRVYLADRILGVVAFCMVLYNPFTLAFDPSFQLSALATIGLIAFTPMFDAHLRWLPEGFGLREIAASTLGTQLAVLPFLLYQNGQMPLYALPANLFALAPVPLAMLLSFIAAAGGMIFGSLATPLAFPAYALLWYIIAVAKFFAALPFSGVSIGAFGAWLMFAAYAAMFGGLWIMQKRKNAQHET
jgi:competence protein ComEC